MTQPRDYQRSTVNPISTLPAYDGERGWAHASPPTARRSPSGPPTAEAVTLRLFATGSDDEPGARAIAERPMASGPRGTWHVEIPEWLAGVLLRFSGRLPRRHREPRRRSLGARGRRERRAQHGRGPGPNQPRRLGRRPRPRYPRRRTGRLGDPYRRLQQRPGLRGARGTSRAVPGLHTRRNPHPGRSRIAHLPGPIKRLGVTCVQLLPFYDYGSVDETRPDSDQFNWGTTRSTTTCPKAPTAPTPTTARRGSANARR